ncbi:MAG: 16S rRNA (uracil(1498)-N(3))-methyltransferase [Myxococcales bacterium]
MNLLLLRNEDLLADGTARLTGRRLLHAREVLRASAHDRLRVGLWGGGTGEAEVLQVTERELVLRPVFDQPPPARPGIDLILALPRPKALRKVLPALASLGADRVVLVNAARVEKSFFGAGVLLPAQLEALLAEGLMQARDTRPPTVLVRDRFRPFVEDELPGLSGPDPQRLVAHPQAGLPLRAVPPRAGRRLQLAVGPEGGWVPFELDLLGRAGFAAFTLGQRVLRVEVAVPALFGALGGLC